MQESAVRSTQCICICEKVNGSKGEDNDAEDVEGPKVVESSQRVKQAYATLALINNNDQQITVG
jgi:hypothetical protein